MGNNISSDKTTKIEKIKQLLLKGDVKGIQKCIQKLKKLDINRSFPEFGSKNYPGPVPVLHFAAAFCSSTTVILLCDEGPANVNAISPQGHTPLMYAVLHNNSSNILPLKLRNCDLNARSQSDGNTALHYACTNGYHECVQALIAAGANVLETNNNGQNCLECAKSQSNARIVQCIESYMASDYQQEGYGHVADKLMATNTGNNNVLPDPETHSAPGSKEDIVDLQMSTTDIDFHGRYINTEPPQRRVFANLLQKRDRKGGSTSSLASAEDFTMVNSVDTIPFIDDDVFTGKHGSSQEYNPIPDSEFIKRSIRKHFPSLKESIDPNPLLDSMYAGEIITHQEHTKLQKLDDREKNDYILKLVERKKGFAKRLISLLHKTGQNRLVHAMLN